MQPAYSNMSFLPRASVNTERQSDSEDSYTG